MGNKKSPEVFSPLSLSNGFGEVAVMTGKQIAGYYANWKACYTRCKIEDLDPTLCTILYYALACLNENGTIRVLDQRADIDEGGYKNFTRLKQKNPRLKTLLGIGEWEEGSAKYSNVVSNEGTKKAFIKSAVSFMQTYEFDGIDFDWEYPAERGAQAEVKANFTRFLQEVRQEFDKHGYLLTVAVGAGENDTVKLYNVPQLSRNVHYINIMTYDLHSYLNGHTGENAPLYSDDTLNVEYCTKAWISNGADPQKILLGVASYGKSYTLTDPSNHGIGAPCSGPGLPGPSTKAAGTLAYDEILEKQHKGWKKQWSNEQQVPYLYHGSQWVGYDDESSIQKKVAFAKQQNLGGIVMWSLDMDDPHGTYGPKFPLLQTIKNHL